MNTRKVILSAVVIGLFVFAGCSEERNEAVPPRDVVYDVALTTAQRATVPVYLEAVGTVRAAQSSQVASQMMGTVLETRVQEGDRVRRGQILAVIDDAQPRAGLDRAVAAQTATRQAIMASDSDLQLAEATLRRYQDLYDKKSVSPQEFDEVKARFQAAQARRDMSHSGQAQAQAVLAQAQIALEYGRMRSPFDGVITERKVDAGALAMPGMPLFTVENHHRYRLETTVNESEIGRIRVGQRIPVRIDALETELAGRVAQIVPAADPATRSFVVKIDLPADRGLHSGLFGRARISRGEKTSILVPRSAVVSRGQLQAVYVLDTAQIAALRYITLGSTAGDHVEVLSGLDGDEKLVAAPANQELGGKKIEAKK